MRISSVHNHKIMNAQTTNNVQRQLNIAKNSENKQILNRLAANRSLDNEVVQALYSRDIKSVTTTLNDLGYERENLLQRLF